MSEARRANVEMGEANRSFGENDGAAPPATVFNDLAAFVDLPRTTGLALSVDGRRLVATVQQPDAERSRYVTSLWEIPLDGGEPVRLTRSAKGETSPAFLPDGTLLFTSDRGEEGSEPAALWALPAAGEPERRCRRPGGLTGPVVAAGTGAVLLTGQRLTRSSDEDDERRRAVRDERKLSAVLHDGMPIRYWDHELGIESTRLLLLPPGAPEPVDLVPEATVELDQVCYSITADASTVALGWRPRRSHGRRRFEVAVLDVVIGGRRTIAAEDGVQFGRPVISPDGAWVAMAAEREATFDSPLRTSLEFVHTVSGARHRAAIGDLEASEYAWSADSTTLYVAGDLHGRGGLLALEAATGRVSRRLAHDAVYASLCPAPDGRTIYALRTSVDSAPTPVRVDTAATDQSPPPLPTPAPTPALPGTAVELETEVPGGARVHSWLLLPQASTRPAPVMQWVHGGPFASSNAWSWRWNPWVAVARGWAVILPDPALSTGYGPDCIDRAWPYRADVVWRELEGVLDAVLERPEVDGTRVALLGGSFGGFMTNWIAGHTTRFGAIVTHAGLWALDQQHATTDAAHFKTGVFGTPAEHPEWYAQNSPHHTVGAIRTPMLLIHGNRDYRVPVSEALRMWWDLVSRWDGDPALLPHRFLQFTGQNHWVLTPGDAEIWWDAVLGFCGEHVLGEEWVPSELL